MKVLLTGSNGLLGQKIVQLAINQSDVQLYGLSRGESKVPEHKQFSYFSVDFLEINSSIDVVKNIQPDAIIHAAAVTNVDYCEDHQEECQRVNVDFTKALAEYAAQSNTYFCFLSTDFIFDGSKQTPYKENDSANPLSVYGQSKYLAENTIQSITNLQWSIVRTCLVFGKANDLSRSNIALWAIKALQEGQSLKIVNDQFRSPTLAEDLANAVWGLTLGRHQGVFNASGPDYVSIQELIENIAEVYHLTLDNVCFLSSSELKQPANRPPRTGFDIGKIQATIQYKPKPIKEALQLLKMQLEENI